MPGLDRNGPMGEGPITGGGRGLCRDANTGRGMRFTGGYGRRGRQNRGFRGDRFARMRRGDGVGFDQPDTPRIEETDTEAHMLKSQVDFMKNTLDTIEKRIVDLEKNVTKPSG